METQSVFLPSYSIGGKDVYKKVPDICRAYGTKAIVIGGEKAMAAALSCVRPWFFIACSPAQAARI